MEIRENLVTILKGRAGELVKSTLKEGECYTLPNTGIYISKRTGIYPISVAPFGTRVEYYYDLYFEDYYAQIESSYNIIIDLMKKEKECQMLEKINNFSLAQLIN